MIKYLSSWLQRRYQKPANSAQNTAVSITMNQVIEAPLPVQVVRALGVWGLDRLRQMPVLPVIVVIWVFFAMKAPSFATTANIKTMLAANAVILVAATGETLILLTGGIDVSVATVAACSAVVSAKTMGRYGDPIEGLAIALLVGVAFGLTNAIAVAVFDLTPFVFTLGTMLVARGIAFSESEGIALRVPSALRSFRKTEWLGVPKIAVIALGVLVLFGLLANQTTWGRHVYLLGSNQAAARYVGIRQRLVKGSVYVIASLMSGLAGYLSIINLGVAIPGVGDTILLTVIGGVIVGGTSLFGGEGSMWRTILGIMLLATLTNGLNLLGFEFYDQLIVQGVVILIGAALAVRFSQTSHTG